MMTASESQKGHRDFQVHIRKQVQLSHHQSLTQFVGHQVVGPGLDGPGQTGEARACQWPMKQSCPGDWAVYPGNLTGLGSHGNSVVFWASSVWFCSSETCYFTHL